MATISNLVVEVTARTSKLRKSMQSASNRVADFAKQVAKVGAIVSGIVAGAMATAFTVLTSKIISTAGALDEVIKTADNLGVTVAALQRLQFQAEQSGVSSEQLTTSLRQMTRVIGDAARGAKTGTQALAALGLSFKDIRDLNVDQTFALLSERLKNVESRANQAAIANVLFGRNWLATLNLVNSNLDQTASQFDKLGIAITQQQGKAIEAFNDARNRLSKIWDGFFVQLTAQTASSFTILLEFIEKTIIKMGGLGKAAEGAAKFIIDGLQGIISFVQGIQQAILTVEIGLQRLAIAGAKTKSIFAKLNVGVGDLLFGKENDTQKAARKAVEAAEKELDRLFEKSGKIATSSISKGLGALKAEIGKAISDIPSISDVFGGKSLVDTIEAQGTASAKEAVKQAQRDKKKTDETKKWKDKLKQANDQLRQANVLTSELQRKSQALQATATVGSTIDSLSKLASKIGNTGSVDDEREGRLKQLFNTGVNKFKQFDPNAVNRQQQELKITVTADQNGIIVPVVESPQLKIKVVNLTKQVVGQQARINAG